MNDKSIIFNIKSQHISQDFFGEVSGAFFQFSVREANNNLMRRSIIFFFLLQPFSLFIVHYVKVYVMKLTSTNVQVQTLSTIEKAHFNTLIIYIYLDQSQFYIPTLQYRKNRHRFLSRT